MDATDWHEDYKAWIETICARHNITATEVARRIGASPSTITRQLKPDWTRRPSFEIVKKIAREFGAAIPPSISGLPSEVQGFAEPEAVPHPFDPREHDDFDPNLSDWEVRTMALAAMGCTPGDMMRFDARIRPVAGDIVLAQVYRIGEPGADTVMRLYLPPYLLAAEIGQPRIKPIMDDPTGERVRIMGVMTRRWSVRKTEPRAA